MSIFRPKSIRSEDEETTYRSPVTGQVIAVYPTKEDWRRLLEQTGRNGPHWEEPIGE